MGQNSSSQSSSQSQIQDFIPSFLSQMLNEEPNTLLSEEINELTYEKLLHTLGELNILSQQCLDEQGRQLVFAVKKGTDTSVFWKAVIQIACVKIDPATQKVESYRLLNLSDFLKVFKTLKCQSSAVSQSKSDDSSSISSILSNLDENLLESNSVCCICFERKQEVSLPCTHSYCLTCIEEWNEYHNTCPICRDTLDSTDDTWVLSEVPKAEEISKEIRSNLMELTEEKDSSCITS